MMDYLVLNSGVYMMNQRSNAVLMLLALFLACTTRDGNIVGYQSDSGSLLVTSNYYGARIFLDYRDTGEVTPAELEAVPVGRHVIHLFLQNRRSSPDSVVAYVEKQKQKTVQFELAKVSSGDLEVTSQPDSARVYVNNLEFGLTPLLIRGLPEGDYQLGIHKSNYAPVEKKLRMNSGTLNPVEQNLQLRSSVLLEHFSNTGCPPCPQADALVDALAEDYGAAVLVTVGYHAHYPSPADPLYQAAAEENKRRLNFYPPSPIPAAYVDGQKVTDPNDEQSYRELIDVESVKTPPVVIEFTELERSQSLIKGRLKIKALGQIPQSAVLNLNLIEDVIDFDDPPGTNGQTHFEAIFRKSYPDSLFSLEPLFNSGKMTLDFRFSLSPEWGDDLTVNAFLQDKSDRTVFQAAWTRYPRL